MFVGCSMPEIRSSTLAVKMSLSDVAAPGSALIGSPVPEADAWNAMFLPSGDQVAELPRVRNVCPLPSVSITNRSDVLRGSVSVLFRLLSNAIFFPSGDRFGNESEEVLFVTRRG